MGACSWWCTFFVATGQVPGWAWTASLPYAILVTTLLCFEKHIDKIAADKRIGVRIMPVNLGERRARPGWPLWFACPSSTRDAQGRC